MKTTLKFPVELPAGGSEAAEAPMVAISYYKNPEKKKEASHLQNYMQLRMSKQAQTSLNKSNVKDFLGKEMAK